MEAKHGFIRGNHSDATHGQSKPRRPSVPRRGRLPPRGSRLGQRGAQHNVAGAVPEGHAAEVEYFGRNRQRGVDDEPPFAVRGIGFDHAAVEDQPVVVGGAQAGGQQLLRALQGQFVPVRRASAAAFDLRR